MTEHPTVSRSGRLAREIVVWSAIVVGTLLFLEGCASALLFLRDRAGVPSAERPVRPRTTPDTLLGWSNVASYTNADEYGKGIALHTTAQGLRGTVGIDAASDAAVAPGIVCAGDSYTFGVGVADDDHWCALLGARLGVLASDMAQESFGLDQAYLWYRRDGQRFPHRVQILGITNPMLERAATGDDNGWLKPRLVLDGDRLTTRDVPVPAQTRGPLEDAAFGRRLEQLRVVQAARILAPSLDPEERKYGRTDAQRPVFDAVLRDLAALHATRGTRLLVVYLPTPSETRTGAFAERRQWLTETAKRRGIAVVDLQPVFRALRADSLDLAFVSRTSPVVSSRAAGQYSPLGHAVVARAVAEAVRPLLGRDATTGATPAVSVR